MNKDNTYSSNSSLSLKRKLHIFGGDIYALKCAEIAISYKMEVIIRTGERFAAELKALENDLVSIYIGNKLNELMENSPHPSDGDIGISISAPWIIGQDVIEMFKGLLFNLHNQPLPIFRGAGGRTWNILMNDKRGGACIHLLTNKVDAGNIYSKINFNFPNDLKCPADYDQIVKKNSLKLISHWLTRAIEDSYYGKAEINDDSSSEYWPRLNTDIHGWINWEWGLKDIELFCNAFSSPHSGAKTLYKGENFNVHEVEISKSNNQFHPFQTGIIYKIQGSNLFVAHKEGTLIIKKFSTQNSPIKIGERLYTTLAKIESAMTRKIQYLPNGDIIDL